MVLSARSRKLVQRLKLRHLQLVETLIETKSVSAAADHLRITQPAVSKGLREIEEILGVSLFMRGPKGLLPTPSGVAVAARARVIQSEVHGVSDDLDGIGAGTHDALTVGAMLVSLPVLLPSALRLMRERHASVQVRIVEGPRDVLTEGLRAGAIDMLVGRLAATDPRDRLAQEVLLYEPIVVVAAANHPLTSAAEVSMRDLADADWVLPPPDSIVRNPVMQLFAQHGLAAPRARVESTSYLMLRPLLLDDAVIAALPLSVVRRDVDAGGLKVLPVRFPHEPLAVGLTTVRDGSLSFAALQFAACLRDAAQAV